MKTIISGAVRNFYEQVMSDVSVRTSWFLAQPRAVRNKSSPLAVQRLPACAQPSTGIRISKIKARVSDMIHVALDF